MGYVLVFLGSYLLTDGITHGLPVSAVVGAMCLLYGVGLIILGTKSDFK